MIDKEIANGVVATDNFKAGKELGTFAKTILKPDSKIGVVAHVKGSSTATEREDGIREGLGEDQNRIQDIVYCNSSYDLASDLTEKMLKERPEIDVVIGTNEYSAVGAARGVKKMGMEDQVKVVGFDNSVEQIQLLEAGVFQGIVIQKPFNIGYLGVEQAVKAIEGYPMEYNLDSGCKLITKENMYEEENQRLLYPFSGQQ
ncbi:sugar-binding domain protein [Mediterraneibacter gnavus CAG:126]|uniref:Sugar-binding domain protein n=1 Tax=Mediterraneibacter gnavus CAG:126 TaxID=1263106 RepID=R5TVL9_MEDGN|nr:sugar-binding domain protein [Mediterraneibacter gnavus CAG:126]